MKKNKYIGIIMLATGMFAIASCSDFDDYNTVPTDATSSANQTLWENISQNSELSNFAALIRKAEFDDELQAAHYYTVWAPKNGTYNAEALMQKNKEVILKEFVKNHIAEYNHTISGNIDKRIHTLNRKSYDFMGNGSYTFDDIAVSKPNLPSTNGVLHLLDGMATFYPNIYEYITEAEGVDSMRNYFKAYELTELDPSRSVVGPIVNGKQTYIDSVMVTSNTMTRTLRAYIDREDSSYTMFMPTNKAWADVYNRIKPYYKFIETTTAQDIANATSASSSPEINVTVNPTYMTDSLTKMAIVRNLIFNHNNRYNRWMEDETAQKTDTILATGSRLGANWLANPDEMLSATTQKIKMSNGFTRIVDTLAFRPWDTWAPERTTLEVGHVWTGTPTRHNYTLQTEYGEEEKYYYHIEPTSNFAKPALDLLLSGVLSTSYNIYAIIVPAFDITDEAYIHKPNQLDFSLSYCKADGKLAVQKLNQKVENDPTRIDTVSVGTFTFPVCYSNLGDNRVAPNLKITTHFGVFNKPAMAKYTRDIRIAGIIMRPVELDEFEAKN